MKMVRTAGKVAGKRQPKHRQVYFNFNSKQVYWLVYYEPNNKLIKTSFDLQPIRSNAQNNNIQITDRRNQYPLMYTNNIIYIL